MASFFLHFVPIVLFSLLVIHLLSRVGGGRYLSAGTKKVIFIAIALLVYRPFIVAMWMISRFWFSIFVAAVVLWQFRRRAYAEKPLKLVALGFVRTFLLAFPAYLLFSILIFSISSGHGCGLLDREPGVTPIFSLCNEKNIEAARRYSHNIYHCRNAFFGSDRSTVYIGFGAETNPEIHTLVGIDVETRKVVSEFQTHSVFRGYCHPELGVCVMLVSPVNKIRLWDDREKKTIKEFHFEHDRPRFLSPDTDKPLVYVASDGEWIWVVDLEKRDIVKTIKMPTGALVTVDNTARRVVANTAMFFSNSLLVYDKQTGAIATIRYGMLNIWRNFGFAFHVTADPARERAFIGASFEGAVYAIDLETRKVLWRYPLPVGIRDMTFDTKRGILYASNFVDGYAYMIDATGKKPEYLGRIYIGRRLRYFNYEADRDVFLAASTNGFHMYDPDPDYNPAGRAAGHSEPAGETAAATDTAAIPETPRKERDN